MKEKSQFSILNSKLFNRVYEDKTVLVTGHTGFKGSWLVYWLSQMGAKVIGYSLEAPTNPNHIELLNLDIISIIGDIRDKKGFYQNFVSDTINAFLQSGLKLYNEMILLNSLGSAAIRVNGTFKSRKVVKVHQNVLVFYKGNPKNIKKNYPELDLSYMNDDIVE